LFATGPSIVRQAHDQHERLTNNYPHHPKLPSIVRQAHDQDERTNHLCPVRCPQTSTRPFDKLRANGLTISALQNFHYNEPSRPGSPSAPPRLDRVSGDEGEHCSSSAAGHVLCALPGRVAQPPRWLDSVEARPEGVAQRGRLLLVTFLGETRKVTCRPATPANALKLAPNNLSPR
jgi:hypothetical protein